MEKSDAAVCLRHAREEMLLALGAVDPAEEAQHRNLAGAYMVEAVEEIRRAPERDRDWSMICPLERLG